jgi:hypothetical protein
MKKLKHSKYKNTGIVFEILARSIVNETLYKKNSVSIGIVKKFFAEGTELSKELKYYQALQEIKPDIKSADRLIDLIIETYNKKVDVDKLNQEKYKLIGEIKKRYDFETFFGSRVSNYKLLASIYKIFEYSASDNPGEHMNCRDVITEHISGNDQTENILTEVQTVWKNTNPDIKRLAFKIIVDKFNEKYQGLNTKQKTLLNKFINEDINTDQFRDYVYSEAAKIKTKLQKISSRMTDTIMRIKLDESINLIDSIVSSNTLKNEHLSAMLKYYELAEELS